MPGEAFARGGYREGVLGVIGPRKEKIKKWVWDLDMCVVLLNVAITTGCGVVKDMVADCVRTIYLQHCADGHAGGFGFRIPREVLRRLRRAGDEPLGRLLVNIGADPLSGDGKSSCVRERDDHTRHMGREVEENRNKGTCALSSHGRLTQCQRYHHHGLNAPCYTSFDHHVSTENLLRIVFRRVARTIAHVTEEDMAHLDGSEALKAHKNTLSQRKSLFLYFLQEEEKLAKLITVAEEELETFPFGLTDARRDVTLAREKLRAYMRRWNAMSSRKWRN